MSNSDNTIKLIFNKTTNFKQSLIINVQFSHPLGSETRLKLVVVVIVGPLIRNIIE